MTKEITGKLPECLEHLPRAVAKSIDELLTNLSDEAAADVCDEVMIGVVSSLVAHQERKGWPLVMSVDRVVESVKHSTDKAAYAIKGTIS